ncbi:MAG: hypothetical protein ACR2P0_14115 [Acidimicrobiales bacterium]
MKRVLLGVFATACLIFGLASPAGAGEYNGKGEPVPGGVNGASECSFSGRDIPDDVEMNPPGFDDDALAIHGVQSYGQLVSQGLKDFFPSPGQACRGGGPRR